MLLSQWFAWWNTIPGLQAEERLSGYTTALLADSGWKMDERDSILEDWRELAAGRDKLALAQVSMSDSDPDQHDKFVAHVYRVRDWLALQFGRGEVE